MCLAIAYCKGAKPAVKKHWQNTWQTNSHGGGFVVADRGRLIIRKGFFSLEEMWKAYLPYRGKPSLVHFRYATHGRRDADNCHPFIVGGTEKKPLLALVHNGILDISTKSDPTRSDTWHYVQHVLAPHYRRDRRFHTREDVKFMGEAAIEGSKFAFIDNKGNVEIWNAGNGVWEDGAWFSNTSHRGYRETGWTHPASRARDGWTYTEEKGWRFYDDEDDDDQLPPKPGKSSKTSAQASPCGSGSSDSCSDSHPNNLAALAFSERVMRTDEELDEDWEYDYLDDDDAWCYDLNAQTLIEEGYYVGQVRRLFQHGGLPALAAAVRALIECQSR